MTLDTQNNKKPSFWKKILPLGLACVAGLILALIISEAVHVTSNAQFCGVCHTMRPVIASYNQDIHGGKNKTGFKAKCVDCHLPHNSVSGYFFTKVSVSINDVVMQFFGDLDKIDWEEKRKHSNKFVYESGCLSCHENLENQPMLSQKQFVAHRDYFKKISDKKCVDCHNHVGHKDLGNFIKKSKKEF